MQLLIKGLRTCIYKVSNLQEATNWYANLFNTTPYFNEPTYVGFNIAGFELGLLPDTEANNSKTDHILTYWGVDDILFIYNKCLELGCIVHEAPNDVGDNIVVASVKDPWNNVIGFINNPHFKLP